LVNELEAKAAADAANTIARSNRQQGVVVLCMYKAQVRRIAQLLLEANAEALTVDASQGREWDHVVLSLVCSDPVRVGFLRDRRRQCVALSRAMRTLTLVSQPEIVKKLPAMITFLEAAGGVIPLPRDQSGSAAGKKRKQSGEAEVADASSSSKYQRQGDHVQGGHGGGGKGLGKGSRGGRGKGGRRGLGNGKGRIGKGGAYGKASKSFGPLRGGKGRGSKGGRWR